MKSFKDLNKQVVQEGRPSQRHPLEGHEYHKKSDEALIHIAKDAHKAAEAMKSHNTDAENKYRDQANDSATVRHFRKTSGMPEWYKKKYGHVKEGVVEEGENNQVKDGDPCWTGYQMVGMKNKGGKKVPNCVPVKEAKEKTEYDYEGDMARGQLQSIVNNAQRVHDMLKDNDNLPEWVQSKITLAEDYISTVANYMMSEIDENFEMDLAEGDEDIHSHRVGDEVVLKNKNYQGVIVKSKGSDISFKNKSDNKHYKATHSMIARNLSKENRHKEKSAEQNKKFDNAIASDMKRIDKSGALKKFGIGVKEQVEQIDLEVVQEAAYVVKHDGVSSDHADADAKKLFAGKTNVNSHMTKYVSSAEKHANMLKSKGFKNVRIQTMNKEEVMQEDKAEFKPVWSKSGKEATHRETGEKTHEYLEMGHDGKPTGKRQYRNAQGKSMGESVQQEEVEQIDELSKDTLKSYMDKSSKDNLTSLMKPGMIAKKHAAKRFIGMVKAGEKLTKEANSANMPADIGTPAQLSLKPNPKKLETPVYEAKSDIPFEGPYSKAKDTVTDKSGAKHGPMSRVRSLARQAIQNQKVTQKKTVNESRRMEIVREAMVDAKKKDAVKKVEKKVSTSGNDKFQADPELSSNITKNA